MIEGATGKFLLQQTAAVSELEAGMISAFAKAALAAARCRGVKLGGDRGARLTAQAQAAGRAAAVQERSRKRATGCESLRAIAAGLEERCSNGSGREVVRRPSRAAVGGGQHPFRGRKRRRRLKRQAIPTKRPEKKRRV
jgi:DNA invertase Pin-like site-specific DNA recombinase